MCFASLPVWSSTILLAWPWRRQVLQCVASTCSLWTLALQRLLSPLQPLNDFPFNKFEKSISDNWDCVFYYLPLSSLRELISAREY